MSVRVLEGDCRAVLAGLPDASVQCVVTSPPYYGLRDYGVDGQIGLERTPDEYVAEMVAVFREVRRALRDDGTLWLNIGDSYAAQRGGTHQPAETLAGGRNGKTVDGARVNRDRHDGYNPTRNASAIGLKHKDLIGIPWMLAFAFRADGWFLRSEVIWAKPNPMPESVTDRPTKSHEQLFLLSKSAQYHYDAEAIAEPAAREYEIGCGTGSGWADTQQAKAQRGAANNGNSGLRAMAPATTRNARSVWSIATQPFSGAHFATMPPELAKRAILAGTSPRACESCGAPWARVVERTNEIDTSAKGSRFDSGKTGVNGNGRVQPGERYVKRAGDLAPTCPCPNNTGTARCTVLDPFGGAGTTGLVADRLGRDAILIELNPTYAQMARDRITNDNPLFTDVA